MANVFSWVVTVCFQYLNLMGFFYVLEGRFDNEIMILSIFINLFFPLFSCAVEVWFYSLFIWLDRELKRVGKDEDFK